MNGEYCVRFIRCDGAKPDTENYYYWNIEDAKAHFDLFKDNDPDYPKMYDKIQLIVYMSDDLLMILDEIRF